MARGPLETLARRVGLRLKRSGLKLATAHTKHVFVGRDLKPVRLPEKYRAKFGIHVAIR